MILKAMRQSLWTITLVAFVAAVTPVAPATAGIIDTTTVVQSTTRAAQLERVNDVLARADVQERLVALGVDPAHAAERAAALNDIELAELAHGLEQAPAGGDFFAIVGVVFIVLLILEFTGTIDIFKKVP